MFSQFLAIRTQSKDLKTTKQDTELLRPSAELQLVKADQDSYLMTRMVPKMHSLMRCAVVLWSGSIRFGQPV